jgi:hypothetical protein
VSFKQLVDVVAAVRFVIEEMTSIGSAVAFLKGVDVETLAGVHPIM